ncbi:SPRY domain containing protein [Entamoeba nuttalli P19]|uniref:SPRY domain containing protein n=1 Tax=Entamoeba nuttalli (strain P19) TaxID=1076696 RepID=K2HSW3_ENTNP|nr:SPRY domain containing protein [Entamoeba nuttalli P19]EKE39165.1 SPRY domain containing protein [Entamoeba nuttalli P19]|eukprot:XP_008858505.1 SPRY domain containing protein [Entamoeba nuttalli P19]
MKVVLHLSRFEDIVEFIFINKKCADTIKALKVNPPFNDELALKKFFKFFTPETLDRPYLTTDISIYNKVKCIRDVIISIFCRLNAPHKQIIPLLSKIVSIRLDTPSVYENKPITIDFFIKHATKFINLQCISGDLKLLVNFFKNYSYNGTNKSANYPKKIIINNYEDQPLILSNSTVKLINKLKSYLRLSDEIQIIIITYSHPSNPEFLKCLTGVTYCYCVVTPQQCIPKEENLCVLQGNFILEETTDGKRFEHLLQKAYVQSIQFNNIRSITTHWDIPNFIKTLIIYEMDLRENQNESNDSQEEDDINDDDVQIDYFLKTPFLEELCLSRCSNVSYHLNTFTIKKVTINDCFNISLQDSDISPFPHLNKISICGSDKLFIGITNTVMETLSIESSSYCVIKGSIDCCHRVNINNLYKCVVPCINFLKSNIHIEGCIKTFFSSTKTLNDITISVDDDDDDESNKEINTISEDDTERNNPLSFKGISYKDLNCLMYNTFNYPCDNIQNYLKDLLTFYKPRKFNVQTDRIELIDNSIKRLIPVYGENFDALVSDRFVLPEDKRKMRIMTQSGIVESEALIHYYEIEVYGYCLLSLGLCYDQNCIFNFDEQHVGWSEGSIGYHSDDGYIYNGDSNGNPYGPAYGTQKNGHNIIGCGYDTISKSVFFTFNGEKLKSIKMDDTIPISAVIVVEMFNKITINYGDTPFKFDLLEEIKHVDPENVSDIITN